MDSNDGRGDVHRRSKSGFFTFNMRVQRNFRKRGAASPFSQLISSMD
jgi:hypothetical protein